MSGQPLTAEEAFEVGYEKGVQEMISKLEMEQHKRRDNYDAYIHAHIESTELKKIVKDMKSELCDCRDVTFQLEDEVKLLRSINAQLKTSIQECITMLSGIDKRKL